MDKEVRQTVRKIFELLKEQQPKMRPRKNESIDVDQVLKRHRERDNYT